MQKIDSINDADIIIVTKNDWFDVDDVTDAKNNCINDGDVITDAKNDWCQDDEVFDAKK